MPIDDALEEIEKTETATAKDSADKTTANKTPQQMIENARGLIGDVLVLYFTGKLPGQTQSQNVYKLDPVCTSIIKKIGLELFNITPEYNRNSGVRSLGTYLNLNQNISQELLKEMIKIIAGDYALQTDLINLTNEKNLNRLCEILPEFEVIKNDILDTKTAGLNKDYYRATINPHLIAMGMKLEYRPLAILAIEKANKKGRIQLIQGVLPGSYGSEMLTENFINKHITAAKPFAQDYVEVAKEYGIKEILPTVNEFNRACGTYLNWIRV